MGALDIIAGIILIIVCAGIAVMILMQESPKGGIGALTGGDSYYNKNQGRTLDAVLGRWTKYFGIAFFVIVLAVSVVNIYFK